MTVSEFEESFLTYSRTNNKPSTVAAKVGLLNGHLLRFFGAMRMDRIGPAEIERYKAQKLDAKLDKKSVNNQLTALRKLLNLAAEWGALNGRPGSAASSSSTSSSPRTSTSPSRRPTASSGPPRPSAGRSSSWP